MHESLAPLNLTQRRTFRAVFLNTTSLKAIPPSECSHGTSLYLSYMVDVHSALSAASGAMRREGISYIRAITTLVRPLARSLVQWPQWQAIPFGSGCVDITWFSSSPRRKRTVPLRTRLIRCTVVRFVSLSPLHLHPGKEPFPSPPFQRST